MCRICTWGHGLVVSVPGEWFDSMSLKGFSNLNDSMALLRCISMQRQPRHGSGREQQEGVKAK